MKALITAPFHESGLKLLANHMEVAYENWRETGELYRDPDDYVERIRAVGANVLISEGDDIVAQVLEQCDIKMIGITRGYPDNVDVDAARGLGIPIFFLADGALSSTMARIALFSWPVVISVCDCLKSCVARSSSDWTFFPSVAVTKLMGA